MGEHYVHLGWYQMLSHDQMEFLIDEMNKFRKDEKGKKKKEKVRGKQILGNEISEEVTYETVFKLLESDPETLVHICNDIYQYYEGSDIGAVFPYPYENDPNYDGIKADKAYDIMNIIISEMDRRV